MKLLHSKSIVKPVILLQIISDQTLVAIDSETTVRYFHHESLKVSGGFKVKIEHERYKTRVVAYSQNGEYLASLSANSKEARLYDVQSKQIVTKIDRHQGEVSCVGIDPLSRYMFSCGDDGKTFAIDVKSGKLVFTLPHHADTINDIVFTKNGNWIALASYDRKISLFNLVTMSPKDKLAAHSAPVMKLSFFDKNKLISVDKNSKAIIWNIYSGKVLHRLEGIHDDITQICISGDDQFLFLGTKLGYVLLYDLKKTDCPDLFSSNTTSELAQGKKIDVVQKYPAGVYYFGFAGAHNDIDLNLSICYDENLSSGGGNSSFFANVGINEVGNSYNSFPEIRTKLVNKNFGLRASFLDGTTSTIVYDGGTDEAKLPITLSFIDDIGTVIVPGIIYLEIDHNTSFVEMKFDGSHYLAGDGGLSGNILSSPNVVAYAAKIRKYKIASLNFGAVSGNHAGLNCQWSSLSSSMCGLPACFNSEDVIKEVFPPAFFPDVLTCLYGDGGVGASPCDQNAYIGNCAGNKKTITPEKYNNYLGCFQCLHDAGGPPIYSDPFAIRPRAFDVNVPTTIFRAGKPTGLEFKALDGRDGSISTLPSPPVLPSDEYSDEYNETEDRLQDGTMFTIDLNVSAPTNCEIKELTLIPYVHFHDGYDDGNYTPNSAGLIFNEIGDINMSIHETNGTEFAKVDADDTPLNDTLIGGVLIDGRLIHEYNANFTVIPDHFEVITTLSNHNTVNNFTYISADLNMSSILDINITAQGEDNLTTVNYTENCYAYPIDLDIGLSYSDSNNTLDNLLYLIEDDNNTYKPPLITVLKSNNNISILNIIKGIFSDKLDHNGTAVLAMNLNFDRRVNEAANPFDMDVTDINATDDEHSPENVKGTNAPDSNATYFYGRAKPNQEFYDNVTTTSIKTPVSIIAYCDLGLIACQNRKLTSLVNGFVKDAQSEANWWFSEVHSTDPGKDGLVTLTTANGTVSPIDPSSIILTNGIDNEVLVTNSGGTTPYIVDINFGPNTDTWLIYNKDANSTPSPFYRVRFIGGARTGKWSTTGNLPGVGHVVGDDINTKKVKRLEW